ncbi:MAG TPA: alpha/beta hydrolase [Solirubrobacterales bacterium]|jgi:pimeloyl-ACP methyl ester carboxylesterase|nr:alpha/beta hydrolase [Solirubrobacterales bacterium]
MYGSPPELDGATHRYIDLAGTRLHVAEAGEGPPVLLLHGWPQHWWIWRKVIPALAEERRLICPDLRGFGWSEAPPGRYELQELADDILALLDELGVESVELIGHDWGAYVGFLLCLQAPERIRHYLALGVAHPWFVPPKPSPRVLQRLAYQLILATPGLGSGVLQHIPGFVKLAIRRGSYPDSRWSEAELDCFARSFQPRDHALASSHVYRSFLTRELPRLKKGHYRSQRLTVPTRLLAGVADPVVRPEILAGYEPYADEMSVEIVERCGHFVAEERPDLVIERARELFGPAAPS